MIIEIPAWLVTVATWAGCSIVVVLAIIGIYLMWAMWNFKIPF